MIVGHGAQVVLVGGGGDRIISRQILGQRPWPGVADWTGRLGIGQLAALLERAADRVINLCERVVFTVTGEMVEMNG